jgi:hypothetical protein
MANMETPIRQRKYLRNKHFGKCGLVVDEPAGSPPLIARAAGRAANPAMIHSIPRFYFVSWSIKF